MGDKVVMLGMQNEPACSFPISASFKIPLLYDAELGDRGYHITTWNNTGNGYEVRRRETLLGGTTGDMMCGVDLDQMKRRDPQMWYWASEEVPLFPGAWGFYMLGSARRALEAVSSGDLFEGLIAGDELHGRDVTVGFGTVDDLVRQRSKWHDQYKPEVDRQLSLALASRDYEGAVDAGFLLMILATNGTDEMKLDAMMRWYLAVNPELDSDKLGSFYRGSCRGDPGFSERFSSVGEFRNALNDLSDSL